MKKFLLFCSTYMIMMTYPIFAEEGPPPMPPRDQGFTQTMIMIAIAVVLFYVILWRPEQKRRNEIDQQRNNLKKGDRVTAMGIIGTVARVQEHTVILHMVDGAKVEFIKSAISDVHPSEEPTSSKKVPISKA